jgi:hypothetical protein
MAMCYSLAGNRWDEKDVWRIQILTLFANTLIGNRSKGKGLKILSLFFIDKLTTTGIMTRACSRIRANLPRSWKNHIHLSQEKKYESIEWLKLPLKVP